MDIGFLSHRTCAFVVVVVACFGPRGPLTRTLGAEPSEPQVAKASDEPETAVESIRIPAGWSIKLFAAEPDVANIVAFDVDHQGRLFVAESYRQNKGVTDNRGHDDEWLLADLAAQTVQDRINYHKRLLGDEVAAYTREIDRVRRLVDRNNDGKADESTIYAAGFNRLEDGTGAGVLARGENLFYTCIPKLWNLIDKNGDGKADQRVVMSDGYGVRVAFRGHDLHGLAIGPDGRLYYSIGDRGYHVLTPEGEKLHQPATGAVFRCELDGSNLEVFAQGLRNPQELAFNDFGDLFTGDNNSDSGDRARIVHVLQGGDSGWRMYYQYLPDRGPFNRERIWEPFHAEQPAYIVPPVANFADGPAGLTYYPGTGFGDVLDDTFFLADFRGTPVKSGIRSFKLQPDGAFYKLAGDAKPVWSILATDVTFGPDGAMWVSDWMDGWNGEGKGRIYRLFDPEHADSELVRQVRKLLASDWTAIETGQLSAQLAHPDRRIRLESQWELARRGALQPLVKCVADRGSDRRARLHAIWGLDQIVRQSQSDTESNQDIQQAVETMRGLLNDPDRYVRAAAAKWLGERGISDAADRLRSQLSDDSPRVRYFAAMALGDLSDADSFDTLVQLLSENDNRDPAVRHAGVMGLSQTAKPAQIAKLTRHPSVAVRRAAVVALRRQKSEQVAVFLEDRDERVVTEAARAIHDEPIGVALEALAKLIDRPAEDDALIRRVLNANFQLGTSETAAKLARYAANPAAPMEKRREALEMLGDWQNPDPRDRVLNRYHRLERRKLADAATAVKNHLDGLLQSPEELKTETISLAAALGLKEVAPMLMNRVIDTQLNPKSRAAALLSLASLEPSQATAIAQQSVSAKQTPVRIAALRVLAKTAPRYAVVALRNATESQNVDERQTAWDLLATIDHRDTHTVIADGVRRYLEGDVPADTHLNLLEAAEGALEGPLRQKLTMHQLNKASRSSAGSWSAILHGGDAESGRQIFFGKTALSCVRCHKVDGKGGEVGPDLSTIASQRDRQYLLESIALPDAAIAEGFETTVIADDLGTIHTGIVKQETDNQIVLMKTDGTRVTLLKDEIVDRRKGKSAMPAELIDLMSAREFRDLVAYLASLRSPQGEGT